MTSYHAFDIQFLPDHKVVGRVKSRDLFEMRFDHVTTGSSNAQANSYCREGRFSDFRIPCQMVAQRSRFFNGMSQNKDCAT